MLEVPGLYQGDVDGAACATAAERVGLGSPPECDGVGGEVVLERRILEEGLDLVGQGEGHFVWQLVVSIDARAEDLVLVAEDGAAVVVGVAEGAGAGEGARRDGVDGGIKVEGLVDVVGADVDVGGLVVDADVDCAWPRVVEVREGDAILCADLLTDDDLAKVGKVGKVVVEAVGVLVEGLELGPAGDGHVERLCGVEGLLVEEVEGVAVAGGGGVAEEGAAETVEGGHLGQTEVPEAIRGAVDVGAVGDERLVIVEPVDDGTVFVLVELELDGLEGLYVEEIVRVVDDRFLVVKGRETHALEMATVALLSAHGDPHGGPLCVEDGFDDAGHLVDEGDGAGDVVEDGNLAHLLPGHGDVFEHLHHGVREVLERAEVDALVLAVLARERDGTAKLIGFVDGDARVVGWSRVLRGVLGVWWPCCAPRSGRGWWQLQERRRRCRCRRRSAELSSAQTASAASAAQQSNAFWPPLTDFAVFRRVFFLSRELLFFFEVLMRGPNILRRKSAGHLSLSSASTQPQLSLMWRDCILAAITTL
ncbi:hypothetical protein L1887_49500 [Cichorium endivia]|nr:hypothetical protein L1887_49500 [Cichorium endivia]